MSALQIITSHDQHRFPRRERMPERNESIRRKYRLRADKFGVLRDLAQEYSLTAQRIHQIVYGRVRK